MVDPNEMMHGAPSIPDLTAIQGGLEQEDVSQQKAYAGQENPFANLLQYISEQSAISRQNALAFQAKAEAYEDILRRLMVLAGPIG